MPQITAAGKTFPCSPGANLRRSLLAQGIDLHNGGSQLINCRGIGTCGTCALAVEGNVSPQQWREASRLALPPHQGQTSRAKGLRLACQTQVWGDITVTKFDGFWGQADTIRWGAAAGSLGGDLPG